MGVGYRTILDYAQDVLRLHGTDLTAAECNRYLTLWGWDEEVTEEQIEIVRADLESRGRPGKLFNKEQLAGIYLECFLRKHEYGRKALKQFLRKLPSSELAEFLDRKLSVSVDFGTDPPRLEWRSSPKKK